METPGNMSLQSSSAASSGADAANRGRNDFGSRLSGISMPFNYKTSGVTSELGKIAIFGLVAFIAVTWLGKGKKRK